MQEASLHMYEHSASAYAWSRRYDESLLDNLAEFCAANSIKGHVRTVFPEPGVSKGLAQRSSASMEYSRLHLYSIFVTSKESMYSR